MEHRVFTEEILHDFNQAREIEWLEANGLGGYASSTVSGAHTRRYHGILVASIKPPVERVVLLSKLEDALIIDGERFELSANQYPGAVYPQGYQHLVEFERKLFPVFTYKIGEVLIQKTIAAIHGENTTVVIYEVLEAEGHFELELSPLSSCRDFHSLTFANGAINRNYQFQDGVFQMKNYESSPVLYMGVPGASFTPTMEWYYHFQYSVEEQRGLEFQEDLFNLGKFTVRLKKGQRYGIILSTENAEGRKALALFDGEKKRRQALIKKYNDVVTQRLVLAADQFIVRRRTDQRTIIAGYHWFSDWGRDTMIALPGLCLVTKRFDDARKIIEAFAASVSDGMLPNRFPDYGEAPEYNTVDATLWFFHAIYQYHQSVQDVTFVQQLLPMLQDIIAWHERGTRYGIRVDTDGLLLAGEEGVQLTWMDAKVGDWVVTPRRGKAVEINALWYNALCVMQSLCTITGNATDAMLFQQKADKVRLAFNSKFWFEEGQYLFDFIEGEVKNRDFRPNQLYALSLPFPVVAKDKAKRVIIQVREKLLTNRGLRSLASDHNAYRGQYGGSQWLRDGCYHQGTVWSFLLGPYVDALYYAEGKQASEEVQMILHDFYHHLDEAGIGTVSEIFDADPPHTPRGCIAQAWGVAEILRVTVERKVLSPSRAERKKDLKSTVH